MKDLSTSFIIFFTAYFLSISLTSISTMYMFQKTIFGKITNKIFQIFDYSILKLVPPLVYLIIYIRSVYIFYDIIHRVIMQLTSDVRFSEITSIVIIPFSFIFYLITLLIPPKEDENGIYCKQLGYKINRFYKYSHVVANAVCGRNLVAYILFLLSTLITFSYHVIYDLRYLVWRLYHTVGPTYWNKHNWYRILTEGTVILLRDESTLMNHFLYTTPICFILLFSVFEHVFLLFRKQKINKKDL